MKIRMANALEMFAIRNTAHFKTCLEVSKRIKQDGAWLKKFAFRSKRFRFVAELEGHVRGYLVGALTNGKGLVEDFLICTNEGVGEISHALLEIFEVHCLQRRCQSILAPDWMDEMLIKARGFNRSGSVYIKNFRLGA